MAKEDSTSLVALESNALNLIQALSTMPYVDTFLVASCLDLTDII